jgi:hypothetical protein
MNVFHVAGPASAETKLYAQRPSRRAGANCRCERRKASVAANTSADWRFMNTALIRQA